MRVRSWTLSLVVAVVCFAASIARAEYTVLVHQKPLHVRHFSGVIVDPKGMTVEYAVVELHNAKTHQLVASTYADSKGYFTFDDKKFGKRIELRVIQKGYDVVQYTVVRRPFGDPHIRLVLTIAN